MARATCATLRLWVSRLCTSRPEPVGLTTCVTPPSRAKNGELAIRSRSTRNGFVARSEVRPVPPDRRALRCSLCMFKRYRAARTSPSGRVHADAENP